VPSPSSETGRALSGGRGAPFRTSPEEHGVDGRTRCEKTTSGSHDYIPDPADPRWPDIRTQTCRHCGDTLTHTRG
jgi:hypothetical protein